MTFQTALPKAVGGRFAPSLTVTVGVIVAASVAVHLATPLPGDVSWLLTVCERMLAGQTLYVDITELNPPMSVWLYLPWVWLAHRIGAAPEAIVALAAIAIGLIAIAVSGRILATGGLLASRSAWWIVATLMLLLAPVSNFAQREHFAVMAVLPMLAAIAVRAQGLKPGVASRVAAGVGGGLAMAIKPHFALAILLPALYAAVRARSVRSIFAMECVVAGAVFVAYVAAAAVLHPAYVSDMLPIAGAIYVPTRESLDYLMTRPFTLMAFLVMAAWIARDGVPKRPLSAVMLAAFAGFFVGYLVQGRGWAYHALPMFALASIGLGLSVFDGGLGVRSRLASALTTVAMSLMIVLPATDIAQRWMSDQPLIRVIGPLGKNLKIVLLADDLGLASPLHRTLGATLVNRGPSLWMAANAYLRCAGDPDEDLKQVCRDAVARERAWLNEDVRRTPPDVVIVSDRFFDWLAWAREDPATAEVLGGYREIASVANFPYHSRVLVRTAAP